MCELFRIFTNLQIRIGDSEFIKVIRDSEFVKIIRENEFVKEAEFLHNLTLHHVGDVYKVQTF